MFKRKDAIHTKEKTNWLISESFAMSRFRDVDTLFTNTNILCVSLLCGSGISQHICFVKYHSI